MTEEREEKVFPDLKYPKTDELRLSRHKSGGLRFATINSGYGPVVLGRKELKRLLSFIGEFLENSNGEES